jgi:hypothetical protein
MTIPVNIIYSFVITLSFILFGIDYNFGTGLTSNRIGYLLLLFLMVANLMKFPIINFNWLIALLLVLSLGFFLVLTDGLNSNSIGFSFGMCLSFLSGFILIHISSRNSAVLERIASLFFVITLSLMVFLIIALHKVGYIPTGRSLRVYIDSYPGGLNKIINSICLFLFVFVCSFIYKLRKSTSGRNDLYLKFFAFAVITVCSYFILFTFSRQGIVFLIFLYCALLIAIFDISKLNAIFLPVLLLSILFVISTNYSQELRLASEIIERTQNQLSNSGGSASNRLYNYETAFKMLTESPLGIGNDKFLSKIGIASHSSYAAIIGGYSLLGLFLLIVLILIAVYHLKRIYKIYGVASVYLIIALLVMPLFNDLIQSPQYLLAFAIFIAFATDYKNSKSEVRAYASHNSR